MTRGASRDRGAASASALDSKLALALGLGLALVAPALPAAGQGADGSVVLDPAAEGFAMPPLPRATVTLTTARGRVSVDVEVAATPLARQRGLMWRRSLEHGRGMLFIFPSEDYLSFWMKNTLIPLDMLFIDASGRVVGVVESATPRSLAPRGVPARSRYVLEVPGGWSARQGVRPGARVGLSGVSKVPVIP